MSKNIRQDCMRASSIRSGNMAADGRAQAFIDPYCKGCYYYRGNVNIKTCEYLTIMDKRRPCPPGKDCTVKRKGRKNGK